jgi:predicted RNA-binding Zn ribbon-like protein
MAIVFDAGPQPGGRDPAPGPLGLVQAFVNTRSPDASSPRALIPEAAADELATRQGLARWLRERHLLSGRSRVTEADRRRAVAVREGIRALLLANNGVSADERAIAALAREARRPGVAFDFEDPTSPRPIPAGRGDAGSALAFVIALVFQSIAQGDWERFKACSEPDCGWAFYDHSRNQTSAWCSMATCGSRVKARAYRARRRGAEPAAEPARPRGGRRSPRSRHR